ncbi:glycosyltransferase [Geomesophilobacter sediminis]|uniref:Glycosyltransferase n=1 Tax=Geomesophilobacter sediminis TaxID=2798584 RepID=A0A8J7LVW5_9BACT|nr:glycosyltransferase [Geomesophilobacter sediminis]MBJ6725365.1 glycosyltransferase [Geomesophilobacter sediminis]
MRERPRISIVTPCYQAEHSIRETVASVLEQTAILSGRAELEYLIRDGGSTDRTVPIIESFGSKRITIISEPDRGMYDALAKGLRQATGDIVAYLNAGDYYHKCAFDIVLDIFRNKQVKWLTGYQTLYNASSQVVGFRIPFRYRRRLFARGLYGPRLGFVQQESTFWAKELLDAVDFDSLRRFRNSGDFYLWHQFAQKADLHIVAAYLGGFKVHPDSLTQKGAQEAGGAPAANNIKEIRELAQRPGLPDYLVCAFDRLVGALPLRVKKSLNPDQLFVWDKDREEWV